MAHHFPQSQSAQQSIGEQQQPQPDLAQLMQFMQQQQLQLQQLQAQLHAQASPGASSASSPPALAPRTERPKLPAPPAYEGRAAALDDWEAELNQQFEWYGTIAEGERLRFAAAYLKGTARDWWTHLPAAEKATIASWPLLVAALRRRFQPVTTAEMARARLATLTQGKASVHEYVTAFRKLMMSLSDMAEADRLFAFTRGLKPAIATQLRIQGVKTVDAAIEMAVRMGSMGEFAALTAVPSTAAPSNGAAPMDLDELGIEGLEKETDAATGSGTATIPSTGEAPVTRAELQQLLAAMQEQRRPHRQSGAAPAGSSPMHRDEAGRLQYGSLTQAQMDAHFAAGTCFKCGKAGHQARKCSKKQGN